MAQASHLATYDFESLTVSSSSVRLDTARVLAVPKPQAALIRVEGARIRWRDDGTAPTSTVGNSSTPNETFLLDNPTRMWNFRAIRQDSTDATLRISYLRDGS